MASTEAQKCPCCRALQENHSAIVPSEVHHVCVDEGLWEVDGLGYCLMHAPTPKKAEAFAGALQKKLDAKDYDFFGVWFPSDVDLKKHHFEGDTHFVLAHFESDAYFNDAQFAGETNFTGAKFMSDAEFIRTTFAGKAVFKKAHFAVSALFAKAEFAGEAHFSTAEFNGKVNFNSARFKQDTFFHSTRFNDEANLPSIVFSKGAYFTSAQFKGVAYFDRTRFAGNAAFTNALFGSSAMFDGTFFGPACMVDFGAARFEDCARFMETKDTGDTVPEFYFGEAVFERPERISFHSVKLQPRWFINTDARKFNFEKVTFPQLGIEKAAALQLSKAEKMLEGIEELRRGPSGSARSYPEPDPVPYELLTIACNRLAENAEGNNRYEEAANFRYMAMESKRLSKAKGNAFWTLHWLYWLSSGYGERSLRALIVLLALWIVFAGIYLLPVARFYRWETKSGNAQEYQAVDDRTDTTGRPLGLTEAFAYSFGVMSLQKPEPKPLGTLTFALVSLETALGPVQAALLALAIRRKFMR